LDSLNSLNRAQRLPGSGLNRSTVKSRDSFKNHLREACSRHGVQLTGHAEKRITSRKLKVSEKELEKLSEAMNNVQKKGGGKSAIFLDGKVFLADVRNMSIITAIESGDDKERVFTGIDSAIFV
jgi:flagellar operon protein